MNSMKRDGFLFVLFCSLFSTLAFGQGETVNASYTLPDSAFAGIPFEIGLNLNRGNIEGIARIQQEWPLGFSVNEVENAGAIFSMSKSQLQFLWITLPKSQELNIRFEVTVHKEYSGNIEIPLVFIYLKDDVRKEITLPSLKMTIHGKGNRTFENIKTTNKPAETLAQVVPNKPLQERPIESATKAEKPTQSDKKSTLTKEKATPPKVEQVKKKENITESSKTDSLSQNKSQTSKQTAITPSANLEASNKKSSNTDTKKKGETPSSSTAVSVISFKIQLAALPQKSALTTIAKEFEISEKEISEEKHNGLFKYTYGEFPTLVEARKKMNANKQMKSKSFVAGYRNGLRIDLEEAIRLSKTK
jgi:hypothetical protein